MLRAPRRCMVRYVHRWGPWEVRAVLCPQFLAGNGRPRRRSRLMANARHVRSPMVRPVWDLRLRRWTLCPAWPVGAAEVSTSGDGRVTRFLPTVEWLPQSHKREGVMSLAIQALQLLSAAAFTVVGSVTLMEAWRPRARDRAMMAAAIGVLGIPGVFDHLEPAGAWHRVVTHPT